MRRAMGLDVAASKPKPAAPKQNTAEISQQIGANGRGEVATGKKRSREALEANRSTDSAPSRTQSSAENIGSVRGANKQKVGSHPRSAPLISTAGAIALEDCGFKLGSSLVKGVVCSGWVAHAPTASGGSSAEPASENARSVSGRPGAELCANCSRGSSSHELIDSSSGGDHGHDGGGTILATNIKLRAAFCQLRTARALAFGTGTASSNTSDCNSGPQLASPLQIEKSIAKHEKRILLSLKSVTSLAGGARLEEQETWAEVSRNNATAASALASSIAHHVQTSKSPGDGASNGKAALVAARDALKFVALLDTVYMEMFIADAAAAASAASAGPGVGGKPIGVAMIPPPHLYMRTLMATPNADVTAEAAPKEAHAFKQPPAERKEHAIPANSPVALNPLLEYLALRRMEAEGPLELKRLCTAALAVEGATPGKYEGTMRGADPIACDTIRLFWDACRDRVAAWSAFACPDAGAIAAIRGFAAGSDGVVEVGAGTGYWAALLRAACPGLSVLAYDKRPPTLVIRGGCTLGPNGTAAAAASSASFVPSAAATINEYHGQLPGWGAVSRGDAASTAAMHSRRVLFMCYPPPGDEAMCTSALKSYASAGGARVALVGEFHGDTGTASFERLLSKDWTLKKLHQLPNWGNTVACLSLWERQGSASASSSEEAAASKPSNSGVMTGAGRKVDNTPAWMSAAAAEEAAALKWPLQCVACGAVPPFPSSASSSSSAAAPQSAGAGSGSSGTEKVQFARDRITRCVVACGKACSRSETAIAALESALLQRHLPPFTNVPMADESDAADDDGFDAAGVHPFTWDSLPSKSIWRYSELL